MNASYWVTGLTRSDWLGRGLKSRVQSPTPTACGPILHSSFCLLPSPFRALIPPHEGVTEPAPSAGTTVMSQNTGWHEASRRHGPTGRSPPDWILYYNKFGRAVKGILWRRRGKTQGANGEPPEVGKSGQRTPSGTAERLRFIRHPSDGTRSGSKGLKGRN